MNKLVRSLEKLILERNAAKKLRKQARENSAIISL
jgi:hypothetical protein